MEYRSPPGYRPEDVLRVSTTDTQAAVIAPPESSPTTAIQQCTPSLNRLAIAAAQSSLRNQRVLQTGIWHGATQKTQKDRVIKS